MSADKTKKDMKTAKDILAETFDKHEHRMADHPWNNEETAVIAAMEAYADYKHSFLSNVSDIKPKVLDVNLSWERGDPHPTIEVFKNGTLMASGWLVNKHD